MTKNNELKIDGCSVYIDQLSQMDPTFNTHDSGVKKVLDWSAEQIKDAIKPAISIMDSLKKAAEESEPDEIELSMQFEIGLKGEIPVLKIVSAETSAQIAIKFKWKNENK